MLRYMYVHMQKCIYTINTNFNTKYLVICKVYTDIGGIK